MASVLDAKVVQPTYAQTSDATEADLVGFGSGIFYGSHDENLLAFVDSLPRQDKKVFIFSTRGRNSLFESRYHRNLKDKLTAKGYTIIGEYSCRGFTDYYRIFKLFGGVNKGHPNSKEIKKAKKFACQLKENVSPK